MYDCLLILLGISSLAAFKINQLNSFRSPFYLMASLSGEVNLHPVFVGNLPFNVFENIIGPVIRNEVGQIYKFIRLSKDSTGKSRGFGYIDYEYRPGAEAAVLALNGLKFQGNILKASLSQPYVYTHVPDQCTVYIGNLDTSVTEDNILSMCGEVLGTGTPLNVWLDQHISEIYVESLCSLA